MKRLAEMNLVTEKLLCPNPEVETEYTTNQNRVAHASDNDKEWCRSKARHGDVGLLNMSGRHIWVTIFNRGYSLARWFSSTRSIAPNNLRWFYAYGNTDLQIAPC